MKEQKIKILVVGQTYPIGGPAQYACNLLKQLKQFSNSLKNLIDIDTIQLTEKDFIFKKYILNIITFNFLFVILNLKHKINKINPHIMHIIGRGVFPCYILSLLLCRKYNIILTVFGPIAYECKYYRKPISLIARFFLKLIEKVTFTKVQTIIVESFHNKKILRKLAKKPKIYVIPDGINLEGILRTNPDILNENLDVFFIGRLSKEKGVDILIKAVSLIIKSNSNSQLTVYIAGKGPEEKELKRLVKELNLEKNIKFLGFISDEDKFKYIKSSKVVVVPSRWDFSPIVIYEAMACGKPVIASDVTNSEILIDGKTGLLFKSEDVEDLANKIITLLADPKLRKKMGKRALEKAKECDWDKIAERHIEIYKKVIADFHKQKR